MPTTQSKEHFKDVSASILCWWQLNFEETLTLGKVAYTFCSTNVVLVQGGFDCIKRHITLVVIKKYGSFPRRWVCNLIRQWLTATSSPCGSDELVLRPARSPNLTPFEFSYGGSEIVRLICSFWTKKNLKVEILQLMTSLTAIDWQEGLH